MEINEDQLQAAVSWWANKLSSCKFDTLGSTRQDPQNHRVEMAEMLAQMNKRSCSQEQIDLFQQNLAEEIRAALANRSDQYSFAVGVDYHPDAILSDALRAAGIQENMSTPPWKTMMWIEKGKVAVRYGYGAEIQVIFPTDT
jgi:hypothetical protein